MKTLQHDGNGWRRRDQRWWTNVVWVALAGMLWWGAEAWGGVAVVELPREGMAVYPEAPAGVAADDPLPEGYWFPIGEVAEYSVTWLGMTVGLATARVDWVEGEAGRKLLEIVVEAESNGLVEMIYPVKEYLRTLVDPYTFLPLSFEKKNKEGHHEHHELTVFDHQAKVGHWKSLLKGNEKDFEITEDMRDLLCMMYWLRRDPLRKAGDTRHYEVMTDEKVYEMILTGEKKETIKLDRYGKVDCLKVEPVGKFNGLFLRKGRMWVWVTDDKRYTMAKMAASVPVASIKIWLEEIRGPGNDRWVKGKKQ